MRIVSKYVVQKSILNQTDAADDMYIARGTTYLYDFDSFQFVFSLFPKPPSLQPHLKTFFEFRSLRRNGHLQAGDHLSAKKTIFHLQVRLFDHLSARRTSIAHKNTFR